MVKWWGKSRSGGEKVIAMSLGVQVRLVEGDLAARAYILNRA